MIIKFSKDKNGDIKLINAEMTDISNDFKTKFLDKKVLTSDIYKIDTDIFFIRQSLFLQIANNSDKPDTKALYIKYSDNKQVIIISNDVPFYNNISIDPYDYVLPISNTSILEKLSKLK